MVRGGFGRHQQALEHIEILDVFRAAHPQQRMPLAIVVAIGPGIGHQLGQQVCAGHAVYRHNAGAARQRAGAAVIRGDDHRGVDPFEVERQPGGTVEQPLGHRIALVEEIAVAVPATQRGEKAR
ncbi:MULTISPECIES: hypothetical protein [unclassified Sphingomonas]|uniref:hypothetical protein n=1 Tax=Novosphingobium rhizosphaerae TaxID=1551649 RepID=UPI0015C86BFA